MFMLLVFMLFFCSTPLYADEKSPENSDEIIFHWIQSFAEVVDLVQKKHYKPDPLEEAMKKSIKSFVSTFDPHSSFLDAENYKELMDATSGMFYGIGIVIDNTRRDKEKSLLVIEVVEHGPADIAGVLSNDKIVEVEGKSLEGLSTEKIITMIKGEKNSPVTIKVIRDNAPDLISFTIKRDVVKEQQSLCFLMKEENMYYLALTMFSDTAMQQMERLLTYIVKNAGNGLILDLRNNSGGLLSSVLDIASLYVPKGSEVVHTKNNQDKILASYKTEKDPLSNTWNFPIIILINNYTASAAEILAGVLKHYAKNQTNGIVVYLVGEKTFGKGSVQEIIPISNNCALKLTTTLYFLPDGKTIQGIGIQPDITIKRTTPETEQSKWLSTHYGHEEKLANTITVYEKKKDEKKEQKKKSRNRERIEKMVTSDNQFQEAVHIIKLLNQTTDKKFELPNLASLYQSINVDLIEEIK